MHTTEAGQFLWYSGPLVSATFCMFMLLITWHGRRKANGASLYPLLICYFFMVIFNWTSSLLYIYCPSVYLMVNIPCYYTFFLVQVVLYNFTYLLTDLPDKKSFPKIHYIVPTVFIIVLGVWTLFIPGETLLYIVESRKGFWPREHGLYAFLFSNRKTFRIIWSGLYAVLIWRDLIRYLHKVEDHSADTGRSSLKWVKMLVIFSLSMVIIPLGSRSGIENNIVIIAGLLFLIIAVIVQHAILCYNTIVGNYVPVDKETKCEQKQQYDKLDSRKPYSIRKEVFEKYMAEKEPWLEPTLRITDLSLELHTNRTALSSFINLEYGMNFSRYINRLRIQEMDKLSELPEYKNASLTQLAMAAGFSSYRSYHMFKRNEERLGRS